MKFNISRRFAVTELLGALLWGPLAAQAASPSVPDAGAILQQVKPSAVPAPSSDGTGLKIEPRESDQIPSSASFDVNKINVTGNTLFDTATLHSLVAEGEGKSLDLNQLNAMAGRITDYYHSHGYPLARAIIPAQTIQRGVLGIEVIEARYGKIELENNSRVGDSILRSTLSPLQGGQLIGQKEMEHALLLLWDIPGVEVSATFKPGGDVGTSDLQIETSSDSAVTGSVSIDNYGNRYTGRARLGGTVNFLNPLHRGDVLSATVVSSGSNMSYGRVGYESLLNGRGTRMGGAYSAVNYILGDTLASLKGHGTAQVSSLWMKHPLVRSRDVNLNGKIQFEKKQLRDRLDSSSLRTDRHLGNMMLGMSGDFHDVLLSGAVNTWSLGFTSGKLQFDDANAQSADSTTANTLGSFSKWNASFSRLQGLTQQDTLYFALSTQEVNRNVDSSEKMVVGGPYSVRAYDMGAISGDTGYSLSAEYRRDMGQALRGNWQAQIFVDSAKVTVNKNAWVTSENSATLSGVGVGFSWTGANQYNAKGYVSAPVGSVSALVGTTNSASAWLEISKEF